MFFPIFSSLSVIPETLRIRKQKNQRGWGVCASSIVFFLIMLLLVFHLALLALTVWILLAFLSCLHSNDKLSLSSVQWSLSLHTFFPIRFWKIPWDVQLEETLIFGGFFCICRKRIVKVNFRIPKRQYKLLTVVFYYIPLLESSQF